MGPAPANSMVAVSPLTVTPLLIKWTVQVPFSGTVKATDARARSNPALATARSVYRPGARFSIVDTSPAEPACM